MSIQQEIVLRHRSAGHLRFSLPVLLCQPEPANRLIFDLQQAPGVYRVDLYRRQRKLSIRYLEEVSDLRSVAAAFQAVVTEIENSPHPASAGAETPGSKLQRLPPRDSLTRWFKDKYQELRETVMAMGIVARGAIRQPPKISNGQSQFVNEFLTDVLVLYLIRLHWHLITQQWLKRPWQHRYEWMAALYMIYLLVRSKKPKA